MMYKTVELVDEEKECVSVFFGNLPVQHQQRILNVFKIEVSFDVLVEYYQHKRRQENFMGLANMRSGTMSAINVFRYTFALRSGINCLDYAS